MSAGAHLSLLVLGCEPSIKAAAIKYGCGFIKELGEGSSGTDDVWFAMPEAARRDGSVRLSCRVSTFSKVSTAVWCVKRMRKGAFRFGQTPEATWEELPATLDGDAYEATLATPAEDEQLVAYLLLKDESGAESSSDTVEVPEYPAWRAAR